MTLDWQAIITYVSEHREAIILYGNSGLVVAIVLQWLKKHILKLDKKRWVKFMGIIKMEASKAIVILFTVLSLLGTAVDFLIDPANAQYIPERFAYVVTAALFLHRFMVSPMGRKLGELLAPYWKAVGHMKEQQQDEKLISAMQITNDMKQKAADNQPAASEQLEPFTLPVNPSQQ